MRNLVRRTGQPVWARNRPGHRCGFQRHEFRPISTDTICEKPNGCPARSIARSGTLPAQSRIPTVVLPITADLHRADEHRDNVGAVASLPGMFTPWDWHDSDALLDSVLRALEVAARGVRSARRRGNAAAAIRLAAPSWRLRFRC
jgi:hypothetical protein